MRILLLQICLALATGIVPVHAGGPEELQLDKARLKSVIDRVNKNDLQALSEVRNLDHSISVPYLSHLILDRSTNPERSDSAREILSSIPGHGRYLRQYIDSDPSNIALKVRVFDVLGKLATNETVRTLGDFLMHDDTPAINVEDFSISSGKYMAAATLGSMNLPNPPTTVHPDGYHELEVSKWQEWWIRHQNEYQ